MANEKEKYERALIDGGSIKNAKYGSGEGEISGSGTDYDDLRNDNYSNLLDTQIQLSLARQNAMKSTNQMLASQGLLGTGYGGLSSTAIQGQYLNAMQNAKNSYYDREQEINANEKRDAKLAAQDEFKNLKEIIAGTSNSTDLSDALSNYGIVDDGQGHLKGKDGDGYWDSLSDEDKRYLQTVYQLTKNSYDYDSSKEFYDYDSMINGLVMNNPKKETANIGDGYGLQDEVGYLFKNADLFAKDGTVVKLVNGRNQTDNYAYVIYKGGKWYRTDANGYAKARQSGKSWVIKSPVKWSNIYGNGETSAAYEQYVYSQKEKGESSKTFSDWLREQTSSF